jgi:hypothetical protein
LVKISSFRILTSGDKEMKRLIIFPVIALLTFAIGVALQSFRHNWFNSNEPAAAVPQVLTLAPVNQPLPPPPPRPAPPSRVEIGNKENSDLSIVFDDEYRDGSVLVHHVKLNKNRSAAIELDLTDGIYDHEVALNFQDKSAHYRILQRYRTSMTVNAEGPHLDLVDWRHFDSPWIPLKSIGPKRFRMLANEEMDEEKFPPTTKSEIVKEVRRRMEREWPALVELVKSCSGPNKGACIVGVSSIYLRIQKQVEGNWIDIGSVEFQIPMGC